MVSLDIQTLEPARKFPTGYSHYYGFEPMLKSVLIIIMRIKSSRPTLLDIVGHSSVIVACLVWL